LRRGDGRRSVTCGIIGSGGGCNWCVQSRVEIDAKIVGVKAVDPIRKAFNLYGHMVCGTAHKFIEIAKLERL
jgi:hypothetical protein